MKWIQNNNFGQKIIFLEILRKQIFISLELESCKTFSLIFVVFVFSIGILLVGLLFKFYLILFSILLFSKNIINIKIKLLIIII